MILLVDRPQTVPAGHPPATLAAHPCIGCGSEAPFGSPYCSGCQRMIAQYERREPDADLDRDWLRRQIDEAA